MRKTTGSTAAKTGAFVLLTLSVIAAALCVVFALCMWSGGVYSRTKENLKKDAFSNILVPVAIDIAERTAGGNLPAAMAKGEGVNAVFSLQDGEGQLLWQDSDFDSITGTELGFAFFYSEETGLVFYGEYSSDAERVWISSKAAEDQEQLYVNVTVNGSFPVADELSLASSLIDLAYHFRYSVYIIGALSAMTVLLCFVFLMRSSGCRRNSEEVTAGWGTGLPFDLLTLLFAAVCLPGLFLLSEYYHYGGEQFIVALCVFAAVYVPLFTGWCMSVSVRIKLGTLWKNTVIFRLFALIRRGADLLTHGLPLIWGALVGAALLWLLELTVFLFCAVNSMSYGVIFLLWLLERMLLVPVIVILLLQLKTLEHSGRVLAEGDLSYKTDTRNMLPPLKRHGENLNSIALGMSAAVEERMKSERLKTELITNVSHDIKTPLTSIINYTDLISREECDNVRIQEYVEVLLRQSARLKRLITDLIDASKASTGNMEVNAVPMDAAVFFQQAEGEYGIKLGGCGLELVLKKPEEPVTVMADGQLLWRIFDNLLGNVCKYAQSGTRVYLSLEKSGDSAMICLKNISAYPLELSAEELTERFTRGDSSRHTEGSGLGLSIARSLTELQKGRFAVETDGDLFKVTLWLPLG